MSTEERIRQLEDAEAIRDLFHTYRARFDARDLVGYSELFTADGEWHGGSTRATGGPAGILAMLQARFTQGGDNDDRHLVANPVIEVNGDEARAVSTYVVVHPGPDGAPAVRMVGEYVDDLKRIDGTWLFSRRLARVDMPPSGLFKG